jgi:hypothetical protein
MPYYLSKNKAEDAQAQKRGWTEVARYVRETDSFHHPITIHPTDSARNQVEDPALLDIDMLQTGHSDRRAILNTVNRVTGLLTQAPRMPVIVGEVCYEGIMSQPSGGPKIHVLTCILNGAGHTYGANGICRSTRPRLRSSVAA